MHAGMHGWAMRKKCRWMVRVFDLLCCCSLTPAMLPTKVQRLRTAEPLTSSTAPPMRWKRRDGERLWCGRSKSGREGAPPHVFIHKQTPCTHRRLVPFEVEVAAAQDAVIDQGPAADRDVPLQLPNLRTRGSGARAN